MKNRLLTMALVAVMVTSAFASVGTVAAETDGDLAVTVDDGDDVVVGVTSNGTAVANATVDVAATDENASYNGTGTHTTDEAGEVVLPDPVENVTLAITATADNQTATTTVTLTADADDDDGNETDDESATNFGSLVSRYVENQQNESNESIGLSVASFVVANNPGNAPDHAGPPSHAGPPADDDDDDDNKTGDKRGPPSHAGGPNDADGDNSDNESNDKKGDGPPSHAGGPK
ncbi:hypothetical protein HYG81_10020 [Natrinema zhouii]|uniref:Uncharacterized protein n=1 Tax=Natrinema zhouii TaxID=1710539 RepID=A0A7D6GIN9_9EURY|nr:hypothetical protein [Natrinema zhouii]QLK24460.1 hypothetical protein HYG81_10020 [Natrinema zhouii]